MGEWSIGQLFEQAVWTLEADRKELKAKKQQAMDRAALAMSASPVVSLLNANIQAIRSAEASPGPGGMGGSFAV